MDLSSLYLAGVPAVFVGLAFSICIKIFLRPNNKAESQMNIDCFSVYVPKKLIYFFAPFEIAISIAFFIIMTIVLKNAIHRYGMGGMWFCVFYLLPIGALAGGIFTILSIRERLNVFGDRWELIPLFGKAQKFSTHEIVKVEESQINLQSFSPSEVLMTLKVFIVNGEPFSVSSASTGYGIFKRKLEQNGIPIVKVDHGAEPAKFRPRFK